MKLFAVTWKGKTKLLALDVGKGNWHHSDLFLQVHVAHKWGMKPSEFFGSSEEDQYLMMAYILTMNDMEAWETKQAKVEPDKQSKKTNRK